MKNIVLGILAVLTLGLAPYYPEPHFFGKIRWLLGGGTGMQAADYFDLLMHGAPWVFLVYSVGSYARIIIKKQKS